MPFKMPRSVTTINKYTRRTCFALKDAMCCGEVVADKSVVDAITIEVMKEGDPSNRVLAEYPVFDVSDDGMICVMWDDALRSLCAGRYLLNVIKGCKQIGMFRVSLGDSYAVDAIEHHDSKKPLCFDDSPICANDDSDAAAFPDCCAPAGECSVAVPCNACRDRCTGEIIEANVYE